MQSLSPGDKVKFKNESYTGIVKRAGKGELVCVEVNGLEIQVHASELILTERREGGMISGQGSQPAEKTQENLFPWLKQDSLHLVAVPADRLQVLTGQVVYWLVNRSSLHVLFSLFCQTADRFLTLAHGIVNSQCSCRLFSRPREDFNQWKKLHIQMIFFGEEEFPLHPPWSQDIRILLPDLKEEVKEAPEPFAFTKSILLCDFSQEKIDRTAIEQLQNHFQQGSVRRQTEKPISLPFNEEIVDLHIEKIDPELKTARADIILRRQLDEFRNRLDHALKNRYHRIIFIHGVGQGVLKKALLEELKHYNGLAYRQASPLQYGAGAIEIILS
jgi:hypothetical protein